MINIFSYPYEQRYFAGLIADGVLPENWFNIIAACNDNVAKFGSIRHDEIIFFAKVQAQLDMFAPNVEMVLECVFRAEYRPELGKFAVSFSCYRDDRTAMLPRTAHFQATRDELIEKMVKFCHKHIKEFTHG